LSFVSTKSNFKNNQDIMDIFNWLPMYSIGHMGTSFHQTCIMMMMMMMITSTETELVLDLKRVKDYLQFFRILFLCLKSLMMMMMMMMINVH
jgi:hypothetical protein